MVHLSSSPGLLVQVGKEPEPDSGRGLQLIFLLWWFQVSRMMRKDVNKPKGKTSAYAFFVQTCREEHRKKNPEQSVNFAEFSKKCSERWKVGVASQL